MSRNEGNKQPSNSCQSQFVSCSYGKSSGIPSIDLLAEKQINRYIRVRCPEMCESLLAIV